MFTRQRSKPAIPNKLFSRRNQASCNPSKVRNETQYGFDKGAIAGAALIIEAGLAEGAIAKAGSAKSCALTWIV